jgi:Cytochrome P460
VWYSPEMYAWLRANRPEQGAPAVEQPVPDGAIMVKEMYTAPAAACRDIDWKYLLPTKQAAAVMVRDSKGSHDGWFWGWYGWGRSSNPGGRWTGRPTRALHIRGWVLASIAPIAMRRRKTTRPSRR